MVLSLSRFECGSCVSLYPLRPAPCWLPLVTDREPCVPALVLMVKLRRTRRLKVALCLGGEVLISWRCYRWPPDLRLSASLLLSAQPLQRAEITAAHVTSLLRHQTEGCSEITVMLFTAITVIRGGHQNQSLTSQHRNQK